MVTEYPRSPADPMRARGASGDAIFTARIFGQNPTRYVCDSADWVALRRDPAALCVHRHIRLPPGWPAHGNRPGTVWRAKPPTRDPPSGCAVPDSYH